MPNGIHERIQHAHAKLTVHLHVTGLREDGFHLLDAEMVSLDLHDTLTFDEGDSISVSGVDIDAVPTDERNIVMKSLHRAGMTAAVTLDKNIPTGGGLGGGSSDAAAALRYGNALDPVAASRIGADVPFCIRGGRAQVAGVGEILEPLPFEERTYTLVIPPIHVDTKAVFEAFDDMDSAEVLAVSARNHLTAPAFAVQPELRRWRDRIREWTGSEPTMAGSGCTWFLDGVFEEPEDLDGARWLTAKTVPALVL